MAGLLGNDTAVLITPMGERRSTPAATLPLALGRESYRSGAKVGGGVGHILGGSSWLGSSLGLGSCCSLGRCGGGSPRLCGSSLRFGSCGCLGLCSCSSLRLCS